MFLALRSFGDGCITRCDCWWLVNVFFFFSLFFSFRGFLVVVVIGVVLSLFPLFYEDINTCPECVQASASFRKGSWRKWMRIQRALVIPDLPVIRASNTATLNL